MRHSDLQLFSATPFLENKLGKEKFIDIPQEPGIYRFYDERDTLLYVGKAKNLRKRLFTYKRASAGNTSRKESALIRKIFRFEYDVLSSETEAFLNENRWIRDKRPEFNHQNKHVETYYYIILYQVKGGFGLEYSMKSAVPVLSGMANKMWLQGLRPTDISIQKAVVFGCYKGHRKVRTHMGALLRLLWFVNNGSTNPAYLPLPLSRNLTPKRCFLNSKSLELALDMKTVSLLVNWFSGRSPDLVYCLIQLLGRRKNRFQREYFGSLTETLLGYYDSALVPYGEFVRQRGFGAVNGIIFQEEIDDLYVRYRQKKA